MELLKLLSTNEIVAQAVCFLLLLAILRKFTWNKFLKLLDARKEKIASDFKRMDTTKAEIDNLKASYVEKLAKIEDEARDMIHAAVMEGRRASEEIRSKAQDDAQKLFEKARENVKVEVAKAEEKLKNRIVSLTIETAERVVEEKFSGEQDKKMIEDFIDKIGKK